MIVDIHTHTFPVKIAAAALKTMQAESHSALYSEGTAEGLRKEMAEAGISLSVVQPVATRPDQVAHINDSVIQTNGTASRTGILSFGSMHPLYEAWEAELERLAAEGVKGIKLHPVYDHVDIDAAESVRILHKCGELGLIVLIHSGWDIGIPGSAEALPEKVRKALDAAGGVKLVAAHMGGWRSWDSARKWLADTDVFLDTAFSLGRIDPAPGYRFGSEAERELMNGDGFLELVSAFGADRILFGTDSPWAGQAAEVRKIRALRLTEEERRKILGRNAAGLLGLSS